MDTVLIRLLFASSVLFIILFLLDRGSLKVKLKDVPVFIIFGVFKILSDVTFFYAQGSIQLSLASLLQMTAPYYVMFISLILFKDSITLKKLFALGMATIGCIMVAGVLSGDMPVEVEGILSATMSGMFFGMFMVGSKISANRGIKPGASLFYILLVADLIALPLSDVGGVVDAISNSEGFIMALLLGVGMTLIPFFIYGWSVQYLSPTTTSTISVWEMVMAGIVGLVFFNEVLSPLNIFGMILVMLSIVIMNMKLRATYMKRFGKYIPPKLREPE